jgi:hypothetical protein
MENIDSLFLTIVQFQLFILTTTEFCPEAVEDGDPSKLIVSNT